MAEKEKEERLRRTKGKRCVVSSDISRREIGDDLSCWLDEPAKGALGFRSL